MQTLPKVLYKTTIVIWTDYSPAEQGMEIDSIAREAVCGDAFCEVQEEEEITESSEFPETEFFGVTDDEE